MVMHGASVPAVAAASAAAPSVVTTLLLVVAVASKKQQNYFYIVPSGKSADPCIRQGPESGCWGVEK